MDVQMLKVAVHAATYTFCSAFASEQLSAGWHAVWPISGSRLLQLKVLVIRVESQVIGAGSCSPRVKQRKPQSYRAVRSYTERDQPCITSVTRCALCAGNSSCWEQHQAQPRAFVARVHEVHAHPNNTQIPLHTNHLGSSVPQQGPLIHVGSQVT